MEDERFQLWAAESPMEMEAWLKAKNGEGFSARLAAGFCWPWSDPEEGKLVDDVSIGDWRRPWNLRPGKRVSGVPSSDFWASDPAGIDQIGCIYTAQGFEYDFGGVIFGNDLIWRNGAWVAEQSESADSVVKRSENFDELIRHTYRVLLTRGLRGAVVYSVDKQTNEFFQGLGIQRL